MKTLAPLMISAALFAQGCARYAPDNTLEPKEGYAPIYVDERGLVAQITGLDVEPTLGGLILLAKGVPPTQGYWDADLVQVGGESSSLTFEFRLRPPVAPAPVGTVASRQIETGTFLSDADLRGIRRLTVIGSDGSRSINR